MTKLNKKLTKVNLKIWSNYLTVFNADGSEVIN
jgi:hypothetical protein